jgi:hypothetical protein
MSDMVYVEVSLKKSNRNGGDLTMEYDGIFEVLNPRGVELLKDGTPLNNRLTNLKDKKIYLIDVGKPQSDDVFDAAEQYLAENVPQAKLIRTRKKHDYFQDEPELWDEVQKNADVFILGSFD